MNKEGEKIHLAWCLQMISFGCFAALHSRFQKQRPQHIPVVPSQRAPLTQTAPRTRRARAAQVTATRMNPMKLRLLRYRVPSRRQSKMAAFCLLGLACWGQTQTVGLSSFFPWGNAFLLLPCGTSCF